MTQLSHARHESAKLRHAGGHGSAYSGAPSQGQVQLIGQVVYPTWAALSPSGEGSRHDRAGRGEGPRQAGQVFLCGFSCHVGIRTSLNPHELNEEWEKPMRWAKAAHHIGNLVSRISKDPQIYITTAEVPVRVESVGFLYDEVVLRRKQKKLDEHGSPND